MKNTKPLPPPTAPLLAGDDAQGEPDNPFHLDLSPGLRAWLAAHRASLGFTTYTFGKVVLIGPGGSRGVAVSERSFGKAMAIAVTPTGFYLSTDFQVWRFENGLPAGLDYQGWDRVYLPRTCHVTGSVDVHDLAVDPSGAPIAAITGYNCLADLDPRGSFNPRWRPSFIDAIVAEDRCHLNGFCIEAASGEIAFASVVSESNHASGWREHRADGGAVIDVRSGEVVVRGLSMPHSPRLHRGRLWVLEAGTGGFGWVDRERGELVTIARCPGFARGLRLCGDYAVIGVSKPRDQTFADLPVGSALAARGEAPICGIFIIDLRDGSLAHSVNITGAVEEIYDVALFPGTTAPLLVGLQGDEARELVFLGPDLSGNSCI